MTVQLIRINTMLNYLHWIQWAISTCVQKLLKPPYFHIIVSKYSGTQRYFTVQLGYINNIVWSGYYFLVQ